MNRIVWTADEHGVWVGVVGEMKLFTIIQSDSPHLPKFWLNSKIDFRIPNMRMGGDTFDVVKDTAERLVAAYVAALGAVFPDTEEQAGDETR